MKNCCHSYIENHRYKIGNVITTTASSRTGVTLNTMHHLKNNEWNDWAPPPDSPIKQNVVHYMNGLGIFDVFGDKELNNIDTNCKM